MEKMKLNLGCGEDIKKDYLNVDYFKSKGVDKVLNLDKFPYSFKDNAFEEIIMQDIFEHLENPIKVLEEVYRISKNKAKIKIRVPHFSSGNSWGDLTHKRTFSSTVLDNFFIGQNSTSLETTRKIKFKMLKKKLMFPKPYRFLGFNQIFSLCPILYERMFYGLFPCGNIYFELEAIKD
jgi:ubiquinone/menaquinone biosynthesis C-methylase UbiE